MAELIRATKEQSLDEIRQWDFDFTEDLLAGVTIEDVVDAIHTPPSGSATTPAVGTIDGNIVPIRLGPVSVTGEHALEVLVELSNGEQVSAKAIIQVIY